MPTRVRNAIVHWTNAEARLQNVSLIRNNQINCCKNSGSEPNCRCLEEILQIDAEFDVMNNQNDYPE